MNEIVKNGRGRWLIALGCVASSLACSGADSADELDVAGNTSDESDVMDGAEPAEIGQSEQALWSFWDFASSCSDPTGTDSVLAAIAVSTAKELRRWQATTDFKISSGMLALTEAGKARCADRKCFNTQALLDLQRDGTSNVQVRPGVKNSPSTLRLRLTWNWNVQKNCTTSLFSSCKAPDHEFRFLRAEPGACDLNHWFEVRTPSGGLLGSGLSALEDKLIWVDVEDNSYIKFQTEGSTVGIDPTYGLNETTSTTTGSCSAACTKISSTSIVGQCCSCNGTKKYARSAWNTNTYLCQ